MAIRMLHRHRRRFLYWLHWEESWVAKRPFIQLCVDAMYMGVDQMQLTEDVMTWNTSDVKKRTPHNRYLYINTRGDNFESFKACKRRPSALHSRTRVVRSSSKCRDNMRQMWPLSYGHCDREWTVHRRCLMWGTLTKTKSCDQCISNSSGRTTGLPK